MIGRPLLITDCDEVLLHMVAHFQDWLGEAHAIDFAFETGDFAGAQFFFEKVRDRQVWDFALVSVSSAMTVVNGRIDRIRVAANGVAARPLRLSAVEEAVKGRARDEQTAELAGSLAVRGARTLQHNAYKVPMLKNLIKRAIRG